MFNKSYFFYLAILLFFIGDIFCFSFFEKQIFYFLLCFYMLYLYKENSFYNLFCITFLLCLESSLYYGRFLIPLLYLIPATLISTQAKKFFFTTIWQPFVMLIFCLAFQSFIIEPVLLHIPATNAYTNSKIIANIIVILCMSLIISSQGNLGNRLYAFGKQEESPDSK